MKTTRFKKLTSFFVALVMALGFIGQFTYQEAKALEGDKVFDLVEITDFHGALVSSDAVPLPVAGVLAKNIKDLKASNPDRTLIIGGGDLYQGSPISNVLKGVPVQKALSNIGMEVTAVGNHEFDWGLNTITDITMKGAAYSMICANMYNKNTDGTNGERVFAPYKIITKDGVRIALIGAITTETPSIVMPAYVNGINFTDPAAEINTLAAQIKAEKKADVILAVLHEGDNGDNATGPLFDIANKLTNVNAVFGGHSHTMTYATAQTSKIPVYIAKSNGKGFIDAKMTVTADFKVSFKTPSSVDYTAIDNANPNGYKAANPIQDSEVKNIVDAAVKEVGPTFNEVIGTAAKDLTRTQIGTPYGESYLGNWTTDVIRTNANAEVAVQNNGGLRSDFNKGNITVGQIYYFMPFDNEINTVMMTKSELKAALEQAFMTNGKGIQISGIKIQYDMSRPSLDRIISMTKEDGSAFADDTKIKVAGPDFILTGGDGFTNFTVPSVKQSLVNTHVVIRDALIADARAKQGIITSLNTRIENMVKTISIVATSDIHGNVLNYDYATGAAPSKPQGLAKVSTYVKGLKTVNPGNVMLVDNGDTIQGTPLVYYYNMIDTTTEYPMTAVMGAMGYDTWTLGNHEFNYGLGTLNRIIADAKNSNIHVLAANAYNTAGGNYVEPYFMKNFNVNGTTKKVAVLGLTNKCIPSWEDPAHYAGLQFNDLVDEAKHWVPIIKAAGADIVIVTAHSGEESATDVIPENEIKALATQVSGIDAIVAGHVHNTVNDLTLKNPEGKIVPVVEPNKWATFVSQIDLSFDAAGNYTGLTTKNVAMDATIAEDAAIVNLVKPYQEKTLQYIQTKLGVSTEEFTGAGQTVRPTAIMELINKVQMEAAGTQLSIAAPLSASARIPSGDIKIQDIMSVYVYENFLYGVKMNGKQLKDWMEYTVRYYKQVSDPTAAVEKDPVLNIADYNLDQLYGATYDIDLTQPACTMDSASGRVASGNRIKNLKVNGRLVKDTDVFTVAINNYRYNGGGGFMKAAGISNTDPSVVTYDSAKALGDDGQVRSLMMSYIQKHGTISPTCSSNWNASTSSVIQEIGVTGVTLNKTTINLHPGDTDTLVATVLPENATNKNVIWSSSDESVATVKDGIVTAVGKGTANITVTTVDGNFTASVKAEVIVPVTGIILNNAIVDLHVGEAQQLVATVLPTNATNKNVVWSSSDETVAKVDNGLVTAVRRGIAIVTVKTVDGNFEASSIVVARMPYTGIILSRTNVTLKLGHSERLVAIVVPGYSSVKDVVWESSNTKVATVKNGVVTAVGVGTATITVRTVDGKYKAKATITVISKKGWLDFPA